MNKTSPKILSTVLTCSLLALAGCSATTNDASKPNPTSTQPSIVEKNNPTAVDENYSIHTFSDGNNNTYTITQTATGGILEYDPVTPEKSSSGYYSGGEPITKEITASEYQTIISAIENAAANTNDHSETRTKKSAQITIQRNSNDLNAPKESYILHSGTSAGPPIKKAINEALDS